MGYRVHSGLIAGRSHVLDGANCQDALCLLNVELAGATCWTGVLADGCSAGKHSETGAQLVVHFAAHEVQRFLRSGTPPPAIPDLLFGRIRTFLQEVCAAFHYTDPADLAAFVNDFLLFTLLGFIANEEETVVFAAGDGVILINDTVHVLDQQNAPRYVGYHLVDRQMLAPQATPLPERFVQYRLPASELQRLAIGSDAWIAEQALLEQIWDTRGPGELQMRMNRWSAARHLRDDASLIVIESNPPAAEGAGNEQQPGR